MTQPHHEGEDMDLDALEILAVAAEVALSAPEENDAADLSVERFGETLTPAVVLGLIALARRPTPAEPKGSGGEKHEAVARLVWSGLDPSRKWGDGPQSLTTGCFRAAKDIIALLAVSPTPAAQDVAGLAKRLDGGAWGNTARDGSLMMDAADLLRSLTANLAAREAEIATLKEALAKADALIDRVGNLIGAGLQQ